MPVAELGFANVDTHRELRQGVPEVVLGEGKTVEQVVAIGPRARRGRRIERAGHPGLGRDARGRA